MLTRRMWLLSLCSTELYARQSQRAAVHYEQSDHELRWFNGQSDGRICQQAFRPEEVSVARKWIAYIAAGEDHQVRRRPEGEELHIFSRFTSGSSIGRDDYIEPLTGMARNPLASLGCRTRPRSLPHVALDNTSYLLTASHCGKTRSHPARSHQRNLLYDMGCSGPGDKQFSSIPTWAAFYAKSCIEFDHLFGWELKKFDQTAWWAAIPDHLRDKVSFFNFGVAKEPWKGGSTENVVLQNRNRSFIETLKATARPEDFVAVKLDIDHSETELSIINAILDSPDDVASLIDELFFEYHFRFDRGTLLYYYWGSPALNHTVDNALGLLKRLRQLGIRAHFWV